MKELKMNVDIDVKMLENETEKEAVERIIKALNEMCEKNKGFGYMTYGTMTGEF